MLTIGKKAFFLAALSKVHAENDDGQPQQVEWMYPERTWDLRHPSQLHWTHDKPYLSLSDLKLADFLTEDSDAALSYGMDQTYHIYFSQGSNGKLVDIHAVEFMMQYGQDVANVCIELKDKDDEPIEKKCAVDPRRRSVTWKYSEGAKTVDSLAIAKDDAFLDTISMVNSQSNSTQIPPVSHEAWKGVASIEVQFGSGATIYNGINLYGADSPVEPEEPSCDCEISHVKSLSADGLEIMVNMLEIGNNKPNEDMLVAAGFVKTTSERDGVWYTKTIQNSDLDIEHGISADADMSKIMTYKYTLTMRTKDAHKIDDEIVYKDVTVREIVFSAIVDMETQTISSALPVQEPNAPTILTRSLKVSPPVSLTLDQVAEVAIGTKVEFDIKLEAFADMFTIRARKCSVQCKSAHCVDKEVCIYGCDNAEPFCLQPFAEFTVNPQMDGQLSFATYGYTTFKWETDDESDVDEQVIVCEVELWGLSGMDYNPTGEPQRECQ